MFKISSLQRNTKHIVCRQFLLPSLNYRNVSIAASDHSRLYRRVSRISDFQFSSFPPFRFHLSLTPPDPPLPLHPPKSTPSRYNAGRMQTPIPTHGLSAFRSPEKQKGHLLDGLIVRISLSNYMKMLEKFFGSPTWTRTRDLRINSPSLYRLSYQGMKRCA